MIEIGDGPIEDVGEEVGEDVLSDFLGSATESLLLRQTLAALGEERRPLRRDALDRAAVRGEFVCHRLVLCGTKGDR